MVKILCVSNGVSLKCRWQFHDYEIYSKISLFIAAGNLIISNFVAAFGTIGQSFGKCRLEEILRTCGTRSIRGKWIDERGATEGFVSMLLRMPILGHAKVPSDFLNVFGNRTLEGIPCIWMALFSRVSFWYDQPSPIFDRTIFCIQRNHSENDLGPNV